MKRSLILFEVQNRHGTALLMTQLKYTFIDDECGFQEGRFYCYWSQFDFDCYVHVFVSAPETKLIRHNLSSPCQYFCVNRVCSFLIKTRESKQGNCCRCCLRFGESESEGELSPESHRRRAKVHFNNLKEMYLKCLKNAPVYWLIVK